MALIMVIFVITEKGTWNFHTYHCIETVFSRSERMKKISYISEIFAFHTIPPAVSCSNFSLFYPDFPRTFHQGPPPEVEQKKESFVDGSEGKSKAGDGKRVSWKQVLLPCWYAL